MIMWLLYFLNKSFYLYQWICRVFSLFFLSRKSKSAYISVFKTTALNLVWVFKMSWIYLKREKKGKFMWPKLYPIETRVKINFFWSNPIFFLLVSLSELKQRYKITAVPKLVIVKDNGEVITDKGRKQIRDRGLACFRTWLDAAEIFQNFKA